MKNQFVILFLSLTVLGSCKKDLVSKYNETSGNTDGSSVNVSSMQDLKVPASFNWSTTKTYNVEITLKSSDDNAAKNVAVKLMSDSYENKGDLLLKDTLSNKLLRKKK